MGKGNVILGYYQNRSTAQSVVQELKKLGIHQTALVYYTQDKRLKVEKQRNIPKLFSLALVSLFAILLASFFYAFPVINASALALLIFISLVALALVYGLSTVSISNETVNKFKRYVFEDEILVIVEAKSNAIKEALTILKQVKAGHPIIFLLSTDEMANSCKKIDISEKPVTDEQLGQAAIDLANSIKDATTGSSSNTVMLKELKSIEKKLHAFHLEISKAEYIEQASSSSTEWFLDNIPVVQGSIEEIRRNLSKAFYRELPKINHDRPRIYAIASSLVQNTSGKVNKQTITIFLTGFQSVTPLTIGELWAFPLMLKFCLLEWIQYLALQIIDRMHSVELANFWGNRFLHAAHRSKDRLPALIKDLAQEIPSPSSQFAEELVDHLFDEHEVLSTVKKWLETRFENPLSEVFHQEQLEETVEQLIFSNTMMSLVALVQIAWQDIFEELSQVDAILKNDPLGIYSQMDFSSRNLYREAIEQLRKNSKFSEIDIAKNCVEFASKGTADFDRHVGYYLIDAGRKALESEISYKPSFKQSLQRVIKAHPSTFYLGAIALFTLGLELLVWTYGMNESQSLPSKLLLGGLAFIPLSEIAIQIVNFGLTRFLPVSLLPKLDYKEGIPESAKTLIVVPMILTTPEDIQREVHQLEIRYLANSDLNLVFGLFSDFKDAFEQHLEGDQALIDLAIKEIQKLEQKYGSGRFYLFHRQRTWSSSENAWIGWERKRGKLEVLNRYLVGEPIPENILYFGDAEALKGICYVITLDSDTQLSKNQGKRLIEILSHPLNHPVLAEDGKSLQRGYTIIQPAVSTDYPHTKNSRFLQIFSDPSVIDPYTHAVSNVYQDLSGEAAYHGKGIYDLKSFHSILTDRYPVEHILSHDLLEGAYVKTGFTGAVCLFDLFPENYQSFVKRQRRWTRGDWQIIDWLFRYIPGKDGQKEKNPLSVLNRWKIFDNLRRSLLPASLVLLFVAAWLTVQTPLIWTILGAIVLFVPSFLSLLSHLFKWTSYQSLTSWHEVKLGFQRAIINTALLPQEAFFSLDSIFRVFYRRLVSHRQLLEWSTSKPLDQSSDKTYQSFLMKLCLGSLFAIALFFAVGFVNPLALPIAAGFCLLWMAGPLILKYVNQRQESGNFEQLSDHDRHFLRTIARATWRYFDDFVGPATNWLPPDNYQSALNIEIAPRTSPTNIGLWLIGVLNAYDLKFITCDKAVDKITATLNSLNQLELYKGHFLNWYDIQTLKPLYPRYISTVDSGNLLACFWTVEQTLFELSSAPLIQFPVLSGVEDTYRMVLNSFKDGTEKPSNLLEFEKILSGSPSNLSGLLETVQKLCELVQNLNIVPAANSSKSQYWMKALEKQLNEWEELFLRYFKWVSILNALPERDYHMIHVHALSWKDVSLNMNFSLKMLSDGELNAALKQLLEASQRSELSPEIRAWSAELNEAVATAQWLAGEKLAEIEQLISKIALISENMNLGYLYNRDRKLFAIGYNVDDMRLDQSYYDLLASEARLASLVAIAKDEVPIEHWWSLNRPYGLAFGKRVLLSWGGTMFEYLMPVLFNQHYPDSLIGNACDAAVECQIKYGRSRGIPWGISESAYSAIDAHKIYQYRSFGVPGLGLKRGLEKDLVISPYSTLLALAINSKAAIKNLQDMKLAKNSLWGEYGYYESVDFTRQLDQQGVRGVVIQAFMAHHQGMGLTAINNILNDDIVAKRFHRDPRISGVEFLLFERHPLAPSISSKGYREGNNPTKLQPFSATPIMGVTETPHTTIPKINILSNHKYSIVVSNTGGGYSRWGDIDITRWRSDTTRDQWGSFFYIKDIQSQMKWSTTFQPMLKEGADFFSSFNASKVEFRRKDDGIETSSEIIVSPEDNAEVRIITLINKSDRKRDLEITSYQELVLAPHSADRAHPAFNKLFIETESILELNGLIAFRRLRSPDEPQIWAAHLIALGPEQEGQIQFETSRAHFIGRGGSLQQPAALENDLTGSVGTVLDPIFSLRYRFSLEPGKLIKISFVTLVAESRASIISLMEKYQHLETSQQAIEMAWTYSQLELRHLSITLEDVQLFQKLAGRILYPQRQLRASLDRLENNKLGQSCLWKYGISGDLPLIAVSVDDVYDVTLIKQLLIAHTFWRSRGLKIDLLILNEEGESYETPLKDQLLRMIQAYAFQAATNTPRGIYLHNINQIPADDLTLLLSFASVFLNAARGSLRQQLVSPMPAIHYPPKLIAQSKVEEFDSLPLPFLELPYFNGLGGYSPDGRTYDIYLGPNTHTPAPWINVIANAQFGTIVTETGNGSTWYGNSQSNRITPWSNDPVLNPILDAIYIRDESNGIFWTPTPSPIRELDAYRIKHGQGYSLFEHNSHGIEQELKIVVPVDDNGGASLRIQRLKLHNNSSNVRQLAVISYQDLLLGPNKEETQMHVITKWNAEKQALLAYNHYNTTFVDCMAFLQSFPKAAAFTGDRTEFIGRNGLLSNPAALGRKTLSNNVGAGLDPCAAMQVPLTLQPGETKEVFFVLGYAADDHQVNDLIAKIDNPEKIENLISKTQTWWDTFLQAVQVDIPDLAINFAINCWLPYQNLSCRVWGRTAFYQSSGAYGFRDQLQDVMALVYARPEIAREQIIRAAARQFEEGDVQHWWDPTTGGGIRTRFSDDLLWLPFATAQYIRVTGDLAILDEQISFLQAPPLEKDQHELYFTPKISTEKYSLFEHCRRAVKKGTTEGMHGLPLIGGGDWNDGMNRVGLLGKGESVWLAWFLIHVLQDFVELHISLGLHEDIEEYVSKAEQIARNVELSAWDGNWYRRAYYDNGEPLGSKEGKEAIIDSLAQSWAVISGAADAKRSDLALQSAYDRLVMVNERLVLLLTPPFDKTIEDPGYIKGYPPGVRENGGQYTHGSLWLAMAFARKGNGNKAVDILKMMHPYCHTRTMEEVDHYKIEPYVMPGDVYSLEGQVGRGGWSWYSGSAAWMYRIWLEEILGFKLRGDKFSIQCCIPNEWNGFKLSYRYHTSFYEITVENPHHLNSGSSRIVLDDQLLEGQEVHLSDDGKTHTVKIVLEAI